jgi:hypothetical protein
MGAAFVSVLFGCNTAQVVLPAPIDAGPTCDHLTKVLCDAGAQAPASPTSCTGNVTIADPGQDASSTFPAGSYPANCVVDFFTDDHAGSCLRSPTCMCTPGDAGSIDDAGDGAANGSAATWTCTY